MEKEGKKGKIMEKKERGKIREKDGIRGKDKQEKRGKRREIGWTKREKDGKGGRGKT